MFSYKFGFEREFEWGAGARLGNGGGQAMDGGPEIFQSLRETRRFFREVSLLIQSVESMLGRAGWECASGNRCVVVTGHILRPEQWMPSTVYRFYRPMEDHPFPTDVSLFLGVLLDRQGGAWAGFQEPWLTFGVFRLTGGRAEELQQHSDWVAAPLNDRHEPNGQFHRWSRPPDDEVEYEGGLTYQAVAALPLVMVRDEAGLWKDVIGPLLKEAEEAKKSITGGA